MIHNESAIGAIFDRVDWVDLGGWNVLSMIRMGQGLSCLRLSQVFRLGWKYW